VPQIMEPDHRDAAGGCEAREGSADVVGSERGAVGPGEDEVGLLPDCARRQPPLALPGAVPAQDTGGRGIERDTTEPRSGAT
jgi:hypothetical protein